MSGSFNDRGQLELADGRIIVATGKKKSGKSIMGMVLFDSYPGDKVVIDVAGDDGPMGPGVIDLHGTAEDLPVRWPEMQRDGDKPMTLRYIPDPQSPTFLEDMDAVVALALRHGREQHHRGKIGCALLVHEMGALFPANRTPGHARTLLNQNRHWHTTLIACGPRPVDVNKLLIQQADLVYIFELNNRDDRDRIAKYLGWDAEHFSDEVLALGRHEYLRFDANELKPEEGQEDNRLVAFAPLPEDVVRRVKP